jgi:hypothetical protein
LLFEAPLFSLDRALLAKPSVQDLLMLGARAFKFGELALKLRMRAPVLFIIAHPIARSVLRVAIAAVQSPVRSP